ncbi:MAG: HDOD domain-containing protein [Deltaproteobacteria bacterium]|nr:HDOD domain-containing protein [Deltaproteobacteria bacterium]
MMGVKDITAAIKALPPFPSVATQALSVLEDAGASVEDVIAIVEYDPSITANVLKLCNSAYYGLSRKVHSLREGLVLLGNAQLKDILLAGAVVKFFEKKHKGYDLAKGDLWKHAVATGVIARLISQRVNGHEPPSLFTAALLHDIGKVVLDGFVDEYFEPIMALVASGSHSFLEAETEVFGTNHAEIGGKIAATWDFPEEIVTAIAFHHRPEQASQDDQVTRLVYLANVIALSVGIGVGADGLSCRGKQEVMDQLGLASRDLEAIVIDFYNEYHRIQDVLGMV